MPLTQVQGGMILPSTTLTTPIVATTMGVGGATPAASGSGITFPATQSASSDANTLDDYEEGTWTPSFSGGGNPTITYNGQVGTYVKIGKTVFFSGLISVSSVSGATSAQLLISGFPFVMAGVSASNIFGLNVTRSNSWNSSPINGMSLAGATQYEIYKYTTGNNVTDSIGTDLSSGSNAIRFHGFYQTTA